MTKVFIGGSRRIVKLNADIKQRIDGMIEKRLPIILGDANGVDKAVQAYLRSKNYSHVEVFCSGDHCRNNVGSWPVHNVPVKECVRGFSFYATKDRAMADEASIGFMIWDKESTGTLMNALRLILQGKMVVIYLSPDKEFFDLKNESGLESLISQCPIELREKIARESFAEKTLRNPIKQGNLFGAHG